MAPLCVSKNNLGLRPHQDAFNAALNGSSLEDANRMEDRTSPSSRQRHNRGWKGAGVVALVKLFRMETSALLLKCIDEGVNRDSSTTMSCSKSYLWRTSG